MIVMKFGGTSVESAAAIERVASIVRTRLERRPVVVVSAMGRTTNKLLAIANSMLGQVRLWNVTNDREIAVVGHPSSGNGDWVLSVACSRDTLIAASQKTVRKWNLSGSGEKLTLTGHGRGTNSIAFTPVIGAARREVRVQSF